MKKDKKCDIEKSDISDIGDYLKREDGRQHKYIQMSDQDIKKLAEDMYKGLVFTDRHIENKEDIVRVFMPIILAGESIISELRKNSPGMIYEYMDKAVPMGINGMPIFFSFRIISKEDTKKVFDYYYKIKNAIEYIEA